MATKEGGNSGNTESSNLKEICDAKVEPEVDEDSLDEMDMVEIVEYDDEETDIGMLADDEDDEELEDKPGLEGFSGTHPDFILNAHKESAVFCCSFDSSCQKLITGGEDDSAYVWDHTSIKSKAPIFKCDGHKDSVICASFSWSSCYFSSCDLSGVIRVWRTKDYDCVNFFEVGDLCWSFWHFGTNVLFAGCDDGVIYMWKIPSGACKTFVGSPSKCECGVLLSGGKRIAAGYADSTVKIFDLKSGIVLYSCSKTSDSDMGIYSIGTHYSLSLIATGGPDGYVKVFNATNGKIVTKLPTFSSQNSSQIKDSVESVDFYHDSFDQQLDLLAAGCMSGNIIIWDSRSLGERIKVTLETGVTRIIWHPSTPVLYIGCLDGTVRALDARTCLVEKVFGRHKSEVLDISISKDGAKLTSSSEDGSVFIYNL